MKQSIVHLTTSTLVVSVINSCDGWSSGTAQSRDRVLILVALATNQSYLTLNFKGLQCIFTSDTAGIWTFILTSPYAILIKLVQLSLNCAVHAFLLDAAFTEPPQFPRLAAI